MVYLNTTAELTAAFTHMIGRCDHSDPLHRPDGQTALQLANLQPGESVLELGAGSGRFIADAKQRVGAGVCVAVDAVQGFIDTDIPWALRNKGLTVYPAGSPTQQVRLLCANITDDALVNIIREVAGAPQTFDCIVALHVFNTIPAHQRRQTLVNLRRLLSPAGRLIVTMSARFTDNPPAPGEMDLPVQFRSTGHTEAPGAHCLIADMAAPLVPIPLGGVSQPSKIVTMTLQTAPDRFWTIAADQARCAAFHAHFTVHAVHNIGKGDEHGLPVGRHSPSQPALQAMKSTAQLGQAIQAVVQPGRYGCVGRIFNEMGHRQFRHGPPTTPDVRNLTLVQTLQDFAMQDQAETRAAHVFLPAPNGTLAEDVQFAQVGVMIVLHKL